MQPEIAAQFNQEILNELAGRFGTSSDRMEELEGFENFIYGYRHRGQPRILRVAHSLHRSVNETLGELEWLTFLADRNLPVSRPVPSQLGNLVETLSLDGGDHCFSAVAFERALGDILDDVPEAKSQYWNTDLFEHWGETMGKLHAATKAYQPSRPELKRREWHQTIVDLDHYLPADQTLVRQQSDRVIAQIRALPQDKDSFGLIHADLTQWNFVVDGGKITVFDFDSSSYGWFAQDIAIALYYAPISQPEQDKHDFIRTFLPSFIQGYRRTNQLDSCWLARIPDFIRLQRVMLYGYAYQLFDPHNLTTDDQDFFTRTRPLIENNHVDIDFDFSSL